MAPLKGNERVQAIRKARAARGLCAECETPLGRGTFLCDAHMDRRNASFRKGQTKRNARYQARVRLGICGRCGEAEAMPQRSWCGRCSEECSENTARLKARKYAKGLCGYCSKPSLPGLRCCEAHRKYQQEATRRLREGKRKGGRILRIAA